MVDTSISKILKTELEFRLRKNNNYSLRAFARDLGISAPRLSRILNDDLGVSFKAAKEIAKKIGFNGNDRDLFLSIAKSNSARSPKSRAQSYSELKSLYAQKYSTLSVDTFQVISEWYHFALVSLMETTIFKNDHAWIAQELGIDKFQVQQALARLIRLGIVTDAEGRLSVNETYVLESQHTSHEAIRNFHSQIIHKGLLAINEQNVSERFVYSSTLSIDKAKLQQINDLIKTLHQEAENITAGHGNKDAVYALTVQFFQLNKSFTKQENL